MTGEASERGLQAMMQANAVIQRSSKDFLPGTTCRCQGTAPGGSRASGGVEKGRGGDHSPCIVAPPHEDRAAGTC